MLTTELFASEDVEHVSTDYPLNNFRGPLEWEGIAYKLEMTDTDDVEATGVLDVAVFTRTKESLLENELIPPIVVRYAWADRVEDFVFWGTLTDESFIWIYHHERIIENVTLYLYGDWPIWQSRVIPTGFGNVIGMLEAVTGIEFTAVSHKFEATRQFRRIERIPLSEMGTPPYQPAL